MTRMTPKIKITDVRSLLWHLAMQPFGALLLFTSFNPRGEGPDSISDNVGWPYFIKRELCEQYGSYRTVEDAYGIPCQIRPCNLVLSPRSGGEERGFKEMIFHAHSKMISSPRIIPLAWQDGKHSQLYNIIFLSALSMATSWSKKGQS